MSRRRRKRKNQHSSGDRDRWMVTYSDMITLLLIFFIILYSMSEVEKSKFNSLIKSLKNAFAVKTVASAESKKIGINVHHKKVPKGQQSKPKKAQTPKDQQKLDQLYKKLQNYIVQHHLTSQMALVDVPRGVQITFRDSILFDLGSAQLKQQAYQVLSDVGGLIKTVNNPISVEGYTDNIPIHQPSKFRSNWELSTARAQSVRRYLQNKAKLNPARLRVVGYGKYHPKVPNDTKAHRAENRRVNIVVLRQTQTSARK